MRAGPAGKTNHMIRELELWATDISLTYWQTRKGSRKWLGFNHRANDSTWNPNKNSGHWGSGHFLVGGYFDVLGGWRLGSTGRSHGSSTLGWDTLRPCPMYLFIWLVPAFILYNRTISRHFPDSVSSIKLLKLRGPWEPLNLLPAGQKCGWPWDSQTCSWCLNWGQSRWGLCP